MPRWLLISLVLGAIALFAAIAAIWYWVGGTEAGVVMLDSVIPTSRLVGNLDSGDADVTRESLSALRRRNDPAGIDRAVELLEDRDPYVWFNAALYLGSQNRREAVPYLIKGLRHPAWRAHGEAASYLNAITGEDFGTDFERWREWWLKQEPETPFDFDSGLQR